MFKDKKLVAIRQNRVPCSYDKWGKIVKWIELGDFRFTDPFFFDTILKCQGNSHLMEQTGVEFLLNYEIEDFVKPKLFIFHVSRCGSTLISQMLAQSSKNIVLSEPRIFDELLLSDLPQNVKGQALIRSLKILGKRRSGEEESLIVKLDSWHLLYFDFIRETFPEAKRMFLFREPSAVLRSQQKVRGKQMVPGVLSIPLVTDDVAPNDLDGYAVKVLERFFKIMIDNSTKADLLLDYSQLPERLDKVTKLLGSSFSENERQMMMSRSFFNSKDPHLPNSFDSGENIELDDQIIGKLRVYYSILYADFVGGI